MFVLNTNNKNTVTIEKRQSLYAGDEKNNGATRQSVSLERVQYESKYISGKVGERKTDRVEICKN